jgi:hypothetical protein
MGGSQHDGNWLDEYHVPNVLKDPDRHGRVNPFLSELREENALRQRLPIRTGPLPNGVKRGPETGASL